MPPSISSLFDTLRPNGRPMRGHFIVCGSDALAYRLVEELSQRYNAAVTVIKTPGQRLEGRDFTDLPGVRVLTADRLDDRIFTEAGVQTASGLALVAQDDVGNIHAAMRAQDLSPQLRLVIRMYNTGLGYRIRLLFHDCAVVSDSSIAAPAFVEAALGDGAPSYFRLGGRTLFATRRSEIGEKDVIAGLAVTAAGKAPVVLPAEQRLADLVLAVAHGEPQAAAAKRKRRRWGIGAALRSMRHGVSRTMRIWLGVTLGFQILATLGLALSDDEKTTPWKVSYQMLVTAFAGAAYEKNDSFLNQLCKLVIMITGLVLVPLITAAIVQASVNTRLALNSGKLLTPMSDHVVVVGLGNVGTRVIRALHDLGVPVVAVDKNEHSRGATLAREREIPFIVGDASREEILRSASVERCKALVIVSTDDVVNLEAALQGRSLNPKLKVVLRLFESDLAERIQRTFNIAITRSVSSIAAPAFAAALMEREVIATIPVGRRVLLVADVPVAAGSRLAGAPIGGADSDQECRVIALTPTGGSLPTWQPVPTRVLAPHDRITVVATRAGLSKLLALASSPTDPIGQPDAAAAE
ncbi:Trk K+ transport system NAD-binding subunit [Allocatelliglobosispora scoriae]|uniref:Trk K+ transport system NAD-binding subunit n=1 Tax=Allocatelliglobosispora scoriae TaxID=643052 RepID=A0A841BUW3_9ACTN|nr:NAD-binding protein [Allocatelliglobosispora scoriae]MBB5870703.1 Trk K+ transport system NAD-binding subunit [Allocatelliglobosispora scoriae]